MQQMHRYGTPYVTHCGLEHRYGHTHDGDMCIFELALAKQLYKENRLEPCHKCFTPVTLLSWVDL